MMIINFGDYVINLKEAFIIYPVMFCLILASVAALAGFIWVCLTPGGDPLSTITNLLCSRRKDMKVEDAESL